ncbi:hypothetical protein [Legionella tunisiensis]|uniref:hypothetical protein n=1 Tax=Legionella tunisiensis TaxID=1034944 RepID=UPI0002E79B29|nr:hypothetical protein [Legionella tunisiensis]
MPLVKEVIDAFTEGFQYLDDNNQRKNRWYEFCYKALFAEEQLTVALEDAAKTCKRELGALRSTLGNEDFAANKTAFFAILAKTLKTVQVKRFVAASVKTETFQSGNEFILERSLVPKKASLFEEQLTAGLSNIKTKFPELLAEMDTATQKIAASGQKSLLFFHENRKTINGRVSSSETRHVFELQTSYMNADAREQYADQTISTLKF